MNFEYPETERDYSPPINFYTPVEDSKSIEGTRQLPFRVITKHREVTTWAPSHIEMGLLSELLSYANIINGMHIKKRKELRPKLDMTLYIREGKYSDPEDRYGFFKYRFNNLRPFVERIGREPVLIGWETDYKSGKDETLFCVELCANYIDCLKDILKPYL